MCVLYVCIFLCRQYLCWDTYESPYPLAVLTQIRASQIQPKKIESLIVALISIHFLHV